MAAGQPVFGIPDKKRWIMMREVSRTVGSNLNFILLGLLISSSMLRSSRESQEESDKGVGEGEGCRGCMESIVNDSFSEV
jgi:hypothetical protein